MSMEDSKTETLDSKITDLLDILDEIEYHPGQESTRRLGDSRSSSMNIVRCNCLQAASTAKKMKVIRKLVINYLNFKEQLN